ncbi:MAG: hypothetical protein ABSB35_25695 [Bryobacteraceae bacterium]
MLLLDVPKWLKALGPYVLGVQVLRAAGILESLKALAPSFIALAVLIVTGLFYYSQVRLAKQKLRHDLYDRRFAIYSAFRDLLLALPEKSDDDIKTHFRKAGIARFEARFLLDDPQIESYLDGLCRQVNENVIGHICFLQGMTGMNDPQTVKDVTDRLQLLGQAKYNLADRHLVELSQQFAKFLQLTDFWK